MNQNSAGFMSSIPVVTRNLLIINVLAYFATVMLKDVVNLNNYLSLHYVTSSLFMPHQIITYMFMHGGISHLFFNMFAVFMFGRVLETVWGPKKFFVYYIITGIGAAALQMIVTYFRLQSLEATLPAEVISTVYNEGAAIIAQGLNYTNPLYGDLNGLLNGAMLGASGAVFGILVAFGMLFPNAELMLLFPPIPIKAKWFVIGYGVIELSLGVVDRVGDNVAHFAHLGGLITGLIILLYWRKKGFTTNGNIFG
ncbi:MAG: rhomboid family intramembrane serine protease [Prevotella sp.]|jgi:membrane associated rhomboid family serine protease|uniref:rhomboid family intramembrane serine protease n=1 Tax=unclassified Dysgonomonas TaxID=2630389 RepID=UPI0025C49F3E|nr:MULTISPECIES: rhomboid family intramembrane serine protease [unclassified Dysgonomonas]MDR1714232.1 rhomboid family intramembrane serine protease [Prevotella sp.]MDR2003759.1 rhomboid family intramembrane serine protease [Prevotella sp.]HMM03211.1 rhomboid family intramembrane serine protease [Dysgonomonas sp.]